MELQLRCENINCEQVEDDEYTHYKFSDRSLKQQIVFDAPMKGKMPQTHGFCPKCGMETHKIVCPRCHNALPESTVNGEDLIICIVGSRGTGKSHFIGVVINELKERIAKEFGGTIIGWDTTENRYEKNLYRHLYLNKERLELTQTSNQNSDNGAYEPYIYTFQMEQKRIFGKKLINYTLVFFDSAGEDLENNQVIKTVNRYICKAAGIIFLVDPMKINRVRNMLDPEDIKRSSDGEQGIAAKPENILNSISQMIRNDRKLKSNQKIEVPMAVTISKIDALLDFIPKESVILEQSPHCEKGYFDYTDGKNVNDDVYGLLNEWNETSFLQQVNINYKNVNYFAVSSLGISNQPNLNNRIERPHPHRIEDPLLWILAEYGVVDGK